MVRASDKAKIAALEQKVKELTAKLEAKEKDAKVST
jgi:hypothetical protein